MRRQRFFRSISVAILFVIMIGMILSIVPDGTKAVAPLGDGILAREIADSVAVADQVTQFGITWTFDKLYEVGQFANGDYWVDGPVTIIAINPPSTDVSGRVMNGSMINPSPTDGATQGYDSAMYGPYGPHFSAAFNAARPNGQTLSAGNPLVVQPNSSLVSTISIPEADARPQLQTAAILTVLDAPAPAGSFRPPYSGNDKTVRFNKSQINQALLAQISPVSSTPDWATVERYFERPWIDHVPNWLSRYQHPTENMPDYGREMSTQVGEGALMLQLDFPYAQKETLLVRTIQLGIDWFGVVQDGGENNWPPNGGHASGRKWPILLAGMMLDDAAMKQIGPGDGTGTAVFGEDGQTFFVSQADIDMTHTPDLRGCTLTEYEQSDLGLPEWGIRHSSQPEADNKSWCAVYRVCCTANAWSGFVLAARIMDAKTLWAHDPLFDYQDRYMATEAPGSWTRSWSDFAEEMWDTYRLEYGDDRKDLKLQAIPGDQALYLTWEVNTTLPLTSTWQLEYVGPGGDQSSPVTGLPESARSFTLTGLTNYTPYTITLNAMLASTPILTDTVTAVPTDIFNYLPVVYTEP